MFAQQSIPENGCAHSGVSSNNKKKDSFKEHPSRVEFYLTLALFGWRETHPLLCAVRAWRCVLALVCRTTLAVCMYAVRVGVCGV